MLTDVHGFSVLQSDIEVVPDLGGHIDFKSVNFPFDAAIFLSDFSSEKLGRCWESVLFVTSCKKRIAKVFDEFFKVGQLLRLYLNACVESHLLGGCQVLIFHGHGSSLWPHFFSFLCGLKRFREVYAVIDPPLLISGHSWLKLYGRNSLGAIAVMLLVPFISCFL